MAKQLDTISTKPTSSPEAPKAAAAEETKAAAPAEAKPEEAKPAPAEAAAQPAAETAPTKAAVPAPKEESKGNEPAKSGAATETPAAEQAADSYEALFPEPSLNIKKPSVWIGWIILLIACVAAGAAGYHLLNKQINDWLSVATGKSPLKAQPVSPPASKPTPAPAPAPVAAPAPEPVPEPTPAAAPPPAAITVDKASVTLRVLNGTTTSGAAAAAKSTLERAGFNVRAIGNAKQQTYAVTTIYYQTGKQAEAEAVKDSLGDASATAEESSSLAAPDNVLVVIGAK